MVNSIYWIFQKLAQITTNGVSGSGLHLKNLKQSTVAPFTFCNIVL
jgi:hypothetical protein